MIGCHNLKDTMVSSSSQDMESSQNSSKTTNSLTAESINSSNAVSSEMPLMVNDILGVSPKIQGDKWDNMQKMRNDAKTKATQHPQTVYLNDQPKSNKVYLTFDDGPDTKITPKVIQVLDQYKVKGNFFFLGSEIAKNPNTVKLANESGHYIGVHGYHHVHLPKLTKQEILDQFIKTQNQITELTGQQPNCIRPPYGDIDENVIDVYQENKVKIIIWSIDTLDWSLKEPTAIAKNVTDNLRAGDIILMHSSSGQQSTVDALPTIIEAIQAKGYKIDTLNHLE